VDVCDEHGIRLDKEQLSRIIEHMREGDTRSAGSPCSLPTRGRKQGWSEGIWWSSGSRRVLHPAGGVSGRREQGAEALRGVDISNQIG
jgi:hypothetical protein